MHSKAFRLLGEANKIIEAAEAEGRDLTEGEFEKHQALVGQAKAAATAEKALSDIGDKLGSTAPVVGKASGVHFAASDPGTRFIASEGYKSIASADKRGQSFTSGLVDCGPQLGLKGTLLESAGGGGGALVPVPQVVPGVVQKMFQPLTVADLLLSGQATGNSVRYITEGTATSGAAGVAEGGTKPESTFGYVTTDEPIKKIATVTVCSDEVLDDAPAVQQFINGRLSMFVRIEEERQLLRGTSGGNEVQGLLTSRNVPVYAGGTAVGNKAVQLFKAANGLRGSSFLEPDFFIVHPGDWEDIRLGTDTAGQFFAGGPFMGPYGSGSNVQASGQATGALDYLWGKPVLVTSAIGATKGTALVGSSQAAQVWRRGGLSVESTNSHSTHFVQNLVAIRAEERLGLAVYRSIGFCEVRLS